MHLKKEIQGISEKIKNNISNDNIVDVLSYWEDNIESWLFYGYGIKADVELSYDFFKKEVVLDNIVFY